MSCRVADCHPDQWFIIGHVSIIVRIFTSTISQILFRIVELWNLIVLWMEPLLHSDKLECSSCVHISIWPNSWPNTVCFGHNPVKLGRSYPLLPDMAGTTPLPSCITLASPYLNHFTVDFSTSFWFPFNQIHSFQRTYFHAQQTVFALVTLVISGPIKGVKP